MSYIYAFVFCGLICAISQLVLEYTKLTPGHMNTILVIIGCAITGFGFYENLIKIFSSGATVPIMNFGYLLTTGAYNGYLEGGIIGLFKGIFLLSGAGLSFTLIISFLNSLLFKVRN